MGKRLLFGLALALSVVAASGMMDPPSAAARRSHHARHRRRTHRVRHARHASAATTKAAEQAQESAEERKTPARFNWSQRGTEASMDRRADAKRDEAIRKLKKLLPSVPDGPQKAELIFRLSEMYWAKSKFKRLEAMQIWDQQLEAWHDKGSRGPQPKLDAIPQVKDSDIFKQSALALYRKILAEYPDYSRKDEVLYNLGSSLYESGDKRTGVEMYWKLIKQYPNSDFAPDAWLQLGEHFFNANKLTQAIKAYSEAVATHKPRIYSYALYKLAWCDFNLQQYDNALAKFRKVIAYAKAQRAGQGKGAMGKRDRIELYEEALSDMVRTYAHLDSIDDAFDFYTNEVGAEKAQSYLERLAKLYDKEGKYAIEIKTYNKLNSIYPYAPEAPANQTAIMNAYAQLGQDDNVRKEVRRMIDLYSPNGVWAKKNAGNKQVLDSAFDIVEQKLAGLVTEQHREAQQTKLASTYRLARDLYKEYLEKFKHSVNSYKFRFYYAEVLYELKQFDDAARQYDMVVQENPKGQFAKPAAYTAVLAWEKVVSGVKEQVGKKITETKAGKAKGALKKLGEIRKLHKGQSYAPTPLTEAEQKLASACDRFVKVSPKDDEVVKVKFKSARLYYIHNHFKEAAQRFGEIIDRWPKDPLARIGAESIVESFNVRSDWTQLNKWSRKFRGNKRLMADKDFAKEIDQFVEGSSFNEIHFVYEPKEKPEQIADRYVAFVKEFPKSKYAMVALFNAVVNYDKANFLEKAIAQAQRVLSDYKNFTISKEDLAKSKKEGSALPQPAVIRRKIMFLNASFDERLAQFNKAADLYEQYAKEFPKGGKRADALFNAGLFREGLGQYDAAITDFSSYVKDYPAQKDREEIQWRIGLILEKKKDYQAAEKYFRSWDRIASSDDPARGLCADYKVVQAMVAQGREKEARSAYAGLLAQYKKLSAADREKPCPLEAAAASAFRLIQPDYEAYIAIPLKGVREKQMAKNLMKKLHSIQDLEKRYTDVLKIGHGGYGIAALYRIGKVYQNLSQEMLDTPCPKRLSQDQCGIYQAALQEKAFPLEEKAIEAFDKAMKKAYELGLYDQWLAKAQEAMKAYEPQRFPQVHKYDLIASQAVSETPKLVEVPQ